LNHISRGLLDGYRMELDINRNLRGIVCVLDCTQCKGMHRFCRDIFTPTVLITDTGHVVFGVVTSLSLGRYRHFGGEYCRHFQVIFAMKTRCLYKMLACHPPEHTMLICLYFI